MSRRKARELALQVLFAGDVGRADPAAALDQAVATVRPDQGAAAYARFLVSGTLEHRREIDRRIQSLSRDWHLDRMPGVDRNILRLAVFELLYCPHVPASAVVNEAVELAKKFSTAESGRFINGILGTLVRSLPGAAGVPGAGGLPGTGDIPAEKGFPAEGNPPAEEGIPAEGDLPAEGDRMPEQPRATCWRPGRAAARSASSRRSSPRRRRRVRNKD